MPFGDRTGPQGLGPMTGRGAGYCGGYPAPGSMNPVPGRGFGRGRGFGGGRGFGWGTWLRLGTGTVGRALRPIRPRLRTGLCPELRPGGRGDGPEGPGQVLRGGASGHQEAHRRDREQRREGLRREAEQARRRELHLACP